MQFCFIKDSVMLTLPVTPDSYEWGTGKNMETVNISQLGDVYLPGGRARYAGTISCLLPAQDYPFCEAGAVASPQYYLDILKAWECDQIQGYLCSPPLPPEKLEIFLQNHHSVLS